MQTINFRIRVDKTMKSQKLVNELNRLLESTGKEQHKHQKMMKNFFRQFQDEEQSIRNELNKENSKTSRKKLRKKLGMVQEAYDILGVA